MSYSDQLALIPVQQHGLSDYHAVTLKTAPPKHSEGPIHRDQVALSGWQNGMLESLPTYFKPEEGVMILHTDLLSTLTKAGELVHDSGGRQTVLVILSDMFQSSGPIEMEHLARMPKPNFIATQKQDGLIPNFHGACVVVVGADTSNHTGIVVRNFWQQYFAAAGTALDPNNYRATPPGPDTPLCR